jgi:hypothetical protein
MDDQPRIPHGATAVTGWSDEVYARYRTWRFS